MGNTPYEGCLGPRLPPEVQKKRLARVVREALTPNQRQVLLAYYGGKTITQIAAERGVNKSTVCRTLHRAEERVRLLLRY